MEFVKKVGIWIFVKLANGLMWLIFRSCRFEWKGVEAYRQVAGKEPCAVLLWHHNLLATPHILENVYSEILYAPVISASRDGELMAMWLKKYPQVNAVRVPHTRKRQALAKMIEVVRRGEVLVITPDGPRGPSYQLKKGAAFVAKATKCEIFALRWEGKAWRLKTWDKLKIPKPFSKITVELKHIPIDSTDRTKHIQKHIQDAMNTV